MTRTEARPLVRRSEEIESEPVDAADGLSKGVLLGPEQGTQTLSLRRFTLEPGAEVPRHTNEIEHEQYVLAGEYVVGLGSEASETPRGDGEAVAGEEHVVTAGDAIHVPAGVVHWYRNEGEEPGAFICAVPNGDDSIDLVE